ncbi:MAG: sarcosine oxidase subunit gamma [Steroidobacterales bacterium]
MADLAARNAPQFAATPWLNPLPPATRLLLHGGIAVRAIAATVWQAPFAEEACRAHSSGSRATLWMGPDEYLLIELGPLAAAPGSEPPAMAQLAQALGSAPHALIDVSHRQVAFEVRGSQAAAILNGGCPLDLDLASFPVGMCTRTLCGKADITLWRTGAATFHVEVWRSFSEYLIALLTEVARDIVE